MKILPGMKDKEMEVIMGNLLRAGVILSAFVVAAGAIIFLSRHGTKTPNYHFFQSEPQGLRTVAGIWKTTLQGSGQSLIQLGLLLLIATPIARIIFSIIGYLLEKDYLYVLITLIVLCVIFFSLKIL